MNNSVLPSKQDAGQLLVKANNLLSEGIQNNNIDLINQSEDVYKKILIDFPINPDANHNLGIILLKRDEAEQAIKHFEISCLSESPIAQFFISKSNGYRQMKKYEEALKDINEAERIEPKNTKVIQNKGIIYRLLNDEEKAFPYILKYYQLKPNDPQGINRMAMHYIQAEKYKDAILYLKKAIKINPNYYEALNNYATSCYKNGDRPEAKKTYEKLLELRPKDPYILLNLAGYYQEGMRGDKAIKFYEESLKISGENEKILNNLGSVHGEIGENNKSADYYRKVLKINPNNYYCFKALCYTDTLSKDDTILTHMEEKFYDAETSNEEKSDIGFGLVKVYENFKLFNKAYEFLDKSNDFWRSTYAHNMEDIYSGADVTLSTFSIDNYPKIKTSENTEDSAIFILGMPRSGTSLIEQIVINHPDVTGRGELPYVPRICKGLSGYPSNLKNAEIELFNGLGKEYLQKAFEFDNHSTKYFTDKTPYNFWNVGFIKKILPKSKIIICNRDLRDVVTSLYLLKLTGGHPFSFNKKELSEYANIFYKVTKHWITLLQDQIYVLDYEDFVNDINQEGEKLFDYLGIGFEKNYLNLKEKNRSIRTASNFQARNKIFKSSVKRWKNHENELADLYSNLDSYKL